MTIAMQGPCPLCGGGNVSVRVEPGGETGGVMWLQGIASCGDCGADQRAMVPVGADRTAAASRARRLATETWNAWGSSAR